MANRNADADFTLIGVDGGATEAKAHHVSCDNIDHPSAFSLETAAASRRYEEVPSFEPMPVADQLRERDAGNLRLSDVETAQADLWIHAAAKAIADVAGQTGAKRLLIGMGMPGLKTADGRGICVLNNGPRMPDYLARLEERLSSLGIALAAPVAALGSDADYCGLGEENAKEGLFRNVDNAYYLGCGTGIADAMKLGGRQVTFDEARLWIQKSWQMPSAVGPTFEKLVSAKAINEIYGCLPGRPDGLGPAFPEVDAVKGSVVAAAWLDTVAMVLAELIFERVQTVFAGRSEQVHRGEAYAALNPRHPFVGTLLDRVVIGQRMGQIYAGSAYRTVFADRLDRHFEAMIENSGEPDLIAHCLTKGHVKPDFLQPSNLRAAPALGAAIAAVVAWNA